MKVIVAVSAILALVMAVDGHEEGKCSSLKKIAVNLGEVFGENKPKLWHVLYDRNGTHKCATYNYTVSDQEPNTEGATVITDGKSFDIEYTIKQKGIGSEDYQVVGNEFKVVMNIHIFFVQHMTDGQPGVLCSYGCTDDGMNMRYFRCYATDTSKASKTKAAEIVKKVQESGVKLANGEQIHDVTTGC